MAGENTVTIVGNLVKPADLRFTASGQATASFTIAVNRRWLNKTTQEWEEAVSFFDVTAWRELGENAAESLQKGDRVFVTGRLEQQTWTVKDTDEKRSKVAIVADDIGPSLRWATAEVTRTERSSTARTGGYAEPGNRKGPNDKSNQEDPW